MRRTGLVLAGLGAFLIVFAVLVASWVTGQVIKFPLNQYASVTLTAPNATYFSASKLTEQTGVTMEATYTIKGNAKAGSSSTAVWNQFVYVYDQSNKAPVQTITRTFAFNRRTAQLVNCCGANVGGNSSIQQTGYVGYVLPIGTKKQTYDVFDANVNKPEPFRYSGIGDVDGTQAYMFTENVAPTQNGTQTVPGSVVNSSAASVTLPQYYQTQTTYWIDPVTGALLNVTQNEKLTLRNTDGSTALVLFNADLVATQASIDGLVAIDNSQVSKASLVGTLLPLATGVVGLLLLVIGLIIGRRPQPDAEAVPSHREPELDAAESEAATSSLVPGLDDEPREPTVASPVVREAAVSEAEAKEAEAKEEAKAEEASATPAGTAAAGTAGAATTAAGTAAAAGAAGAASAASAETKAEEASAEEAKAGETQAAAAKAADAKAADAEAKAEGAEAKAEDKAAEADTEPASPAAAAEAAEAKSEAAQAEATAGESKAQADAKAEETPAGEAQAAEAKADAADTPADAPAATNAPAADAPAADAPATDAPAAETPAAANAEANASAANAEANASAANAETKATETPAEAATAEIPAVDAETAESQTPADATAETPATSRRRRGAHRR